MYKEGLIVVGLKNQFFLNYFLWFKHFLKDSSRSCLAAMTFGAQALRLLYGCMWIEGRLDMSWKENGGMLVSKPLKGEEWSGSPNHFWSQAGNLSGRRVVCVSRKPSLRGHFVTWTSFKLRVKVRLGQRNKITMFNIKITRFRMEISISSLYLIPHNIVLIAFSPFPPSACLSTKLALFLEESGIHSIWFGLPAPLIPAPNMIFLPPLLNPWSPEAPLATSCVLTAVLSQLWPTATALLLLTSWKWSRRKFSGQKSDWRRISACIACHWRCASNAECKHLMPGEVCTRGLGVCTGGPPGHRASLSVLL